MVFPLLLAAALSAQTISAVHVLGSKSYSPAQVVAASGLRVGEPFSKDVVQAAANRLVSTGAFAKVQYSYTERGSEAALTFTVADQAQMVPVRFDNFVWLTPAQLQQALATVPLYDGKLPANGTLIQAVTQRLQQLLATHGAAGTVEETLQKSNSTYAYVFQVQGAQLTAAEYQFPGAPSDLVPQLQNAIAEYGPEVGLDHGYSEQAMVAFAQGTLSDVCRHAGYLGASIAAPEVHLLPGSNQQVLVTLPVTPGPVYHLGSFSCAGATVIGCGQLEVQVLKQSGLHKGDVVHFDQLQKGVLPLTDLYKKKGYFGAQVKAVPQLDATAGTADVEIDIMQGPIYTFGQLTVRGFDPKSTAKITAAWKAVPGATFDPKYLNELTESLHTILRYQYVADPATQSVNVILLPPKPKAGSTGH